MNAVSAASGSLAFTASARLEFLIGRAPDSDDLRALAAVKNNLGRRAPTLRFRIKAQMLDLDVDGGVPQDVAAVEWAGTDDTLSAEDLLTKRASREDRTRLAEAKEFLENILADGPLPKPEVMEAGRQRGIEKRTLERAITETGWSKARGNLRYGGVQLWGLPDHTPDDYRQGPEARVRAGRRAKAARQWTKEDEAFLESVL